MASSVTEVILRPTVNKNQGLKHKTSGVKAEPLPQPETLQNILLQIMLTLRSDSEMALESAGPGGRCHHLCALKATQPHQTLPQGIYTEVQDSQHLPRCVVPAVSQMGT